MAKSDPEKDKRILKAITIVGPRNYNALAKVVKEKPEKIRYKLKKQLPSKGLLVYAIIDLSKIGLRPFYADLKFTPMWRSSAGLLLQALHEHSYLVYYTGYLTESTVAVHFALPYGAENAITDLLDEMVNLEILEGYNAKPGKWVNYLSVQADYFDLSRGEWDIDWSKLKPLEKLKEPIRYDQPPAKLQVDKYDLLALKELQLNAQTPIRLMAKKLGVNEKTLAYHFNKHVIGSGIIRGYAIKWWGGPAYAKTNTIIFAEMRVNNVGAKRVDAYRRVLEALPFTVSTRMLGNNEILIAQATIPTHLFNKALEFLAYNLISENLFENFELRFINASNKESMSFTIPVMLFDGAKWVLKTAELKSKLRTVHRMIIENTQT